MIAAHQPGSSVGRSVARSRLAARPTLADEIPAETLDGPGPRLALSGNFEAAPGHRVDGRLVIGPLWRPSSTLAVHLVVPGSGSFAADGALNGRLLLSIREILAEVFGNPAMMAPIFAILKETARDSVLVRTDADGRTETRVLMRGGALLWDDLVQVSSHARLSIPRRANVIDYRVLADPLPA